jgi:hypothetical protein
MTMFALTTGSKLDCGKYLVEISENPSHPIILMLNLSSANLLGMVWNSVRNFLQHISLVFSNSSELRKVRAQSKLAKLYSGW